MNPDQKLTDLKAGDPVVLDSSRFGTEILHLRKISRITPTQIILTLKHSNLVEPYDVRFNSRTGYEIGVRDVYAARCLRVPTPELLARIERRELVEKIKSTRWDILPIQTLRNVNTQLQDLK